MAVEVAINASVIEQPPAFGARFRSAKPFPQVVIDEFFSRPRCGRLQRDFPEFDASRARNKLGEIGGKAVHPDLAAVGPVYAELDALLRAPAFIDLVTTLTTIDGLQLDPEYVGGGAHHNMNGQDLDQHVDFNYHPHTGLHRRLNLLFYFNDEWREEGGRMS
ncbi:MAG: 2OG-Fe(II) oxygenase [Acidobacteria bacterium]|nr:2OG-Fe(II) oxygenase [Acidobacteriota bacterium]